MKIALCLSGQPRYLEIGYEHLFREFLSKYSIDVFSHLWFDSKLKNTPFSYTINYPNRNELWRENLNDLILNLYKPKLCLFEEPKQFSFYSEANYGMGKTNNCSMFYSIQKCNELKLEYERIHNFKYDLVIRARTDLVISNFTLNLNNIDKQKIHTSSTHCYFPDGTEINNDQIAIGSSPLMDAYSSLYNFLYFYWFKDKPESMCGERILTHHLRNCNIPSICHKTENFSNDIFKG